jgi:hypothetical protein
MFNESIQEFAADLKMLYDKGFPRRDRDTRREDLLRTWRSLPDQSHRSATASKRLIHTLHFSFPVKGGSLLLLFGLTCVEASACSKSESEEMFESDESVDTQGVRLLPELLPRLQDASGDFVYDQLSSTITKSYKKLSRELGNRFGEVDTTRMYISKFNNRRQMFNESIQEFAADLKIIYNMI